MGAERSLEQSFVRWCKDHLYRAKKLQLIREKGFPDRTIFLGSGRIAFVELKAPGGTLTPHQRAWLEYLQANGYCAGVARSLEEAREIIYRHG